MRLPRGFTLVELVTVIAIVSILAVTILPRFANQSDFNQAGYRDQVVSAMQYARKIAIASRRHVCVTVANSSVSLSLDARTPETVGSSALSCSTPLLLPGSSLAQTTPPNGAVLGSAGFAFDPQGQAVSSSAPSTLVAQSIASQGGLAITVEQTGYVH